MLLKHRITEEQRHVRLRRQDRSGTVRWHVKEYLEEDVRLRAKSRFPCCSTKGIPERNERWKTRHVVAQKTKCFPSVVSEVVRDASKSVWTHGKSLIYGALEVETQGRAIEGISMVERSLPDAVACTVGHCSFAGGLSGIAAARANGSLSLAGPGLSRLTPAVPGPSAVAPTALPRRK